MNKFEFTPIDFSKLHTGSVLLCFSSKNLLADVEIAVERPEARRRGIPDDYPLATHVAMILEVKTPYTISKQVGFLFWKKTKNITLNPGILVFEETSDGFTINPISKYYNTNCVQVLRRVKPFTPEQIITLQDSILKYWAESITYGWLAFVTQPIHTILGKDVISKVNENMMICSEVGAVCVNDTCHSVNEPYDFEDEANVNPLEWQVSEKFEQDVEIQPKV